MAEKRIPLRTCIACRKEFAKNDLLRIVKNKDGEIFMDKSGKASGRGAYICYSRDCSLKLMKNKLLNKVFQCQIDNETYSKITEDLLGYDK